MFLLNGPFSKVSLRCGVILHTLVSDSDKLYFLQMMNNPFLTPDQVEMLRYNNIVSGEHPTLKDLGISGKTIQSILPQYIYRFRAGGQFG